MQSWIGGCEQLKGTGRLPQVEVITFLGYMKAVESRLLQRLSAGGHLLRNLIRRRTPREPVSPDPLKSSPPFTREDRTLPKGACRQETGREEESKPSRLPIVFIHYGNSDYLQHSLRQAKRTNPHSPLYLLGDESNDCYEEVIHHPFADYAQEAEAFSRIYKHYNTTPFHYELFNFQRWFILQEFLHHNYLERCLYLDSDTLFYADASKEQKRFAPFDFTLSKKTSGCTFFLNRREALNNFCRFLTGIYTRRDRYAYDRMVAHFALRQKHRLEGGVCDMTAFGLYGELYFGHIGEVALINDGSIYDPNINTPDPGFAMHDGIKKVIWKQGYPYGIHLKTGQEIRFNSLQFQGRAKRLMPHFLQEPYA